MKILYIVLVAILPVGAFAADYTVKTSAGDYSNIITCVNSISAGDRCVVYSGTYPGGNITTSGSSNTTRKTLIADSGGTQPIISSAINVTDEEYITISGFEFSGMGAGQAVSGSGCGYITIHNNDINNTDIGIGTSGGGLLCDNILIDGNRFAEDRGDDVVKLNGEKWVVRNNTATDINDSLDEHIDFLQVHTCNNDMSDYVLIENNYYGRITGANTHFFLVNCGDSGGANNFIIRQNTIKDIGSGALSFSNFSPTGNGMSAYNNTFAEISGGSPPTWLDYIAAISGDISSETGIVSNNLLYNAVDPTGAEVVYPETGFSCLGSLVYEPGGTVTTDGCLQNCGSDCIVNSDPLFTDYSANLLTLTGSSPAVDNGFSLTTVAASDTGTGTILVVDNPYPFQDGWAGVDPDWIAVGTVINTVQIASINYSTGTITIANSISRNDGDDVWLYKKSDGGIVIVGDAPDIGAHEWQQQYYLTGSMPLVQ